MYCILSPIILILCLVSGTQTIVTNRIPKAIWARDWEGNYTELCGMPCVHAFDHLNPDAELLIAMNNGDVQNALNRKSNVSIRILGSHESEHYYSMLNLEYLNTHFDGSAVLDWNSDIPWVLMPDMDEMRNIQLPKDPILKATFVARNCQPMNNRNTYVTEIDSVIGVVAPSICFHNKEWPKCGGRECTKVEFIRNYKIHLAFENGDSTNYVSEKIYHAFQAGVLPVYMGTRGVSEAVPKGSYIDVADFDSPKSLALYLEKVLANDTLYQSYFEWKYKPFEKEFADRFRVLWSEPFFCRLCRYVDAYKNNLKWDQYRQRATSIQVENRGVVPLTAHNSTFQEAPSTHSSIFQEALTTHSSIFQEVHFSRRHGYILLLCFVVCFFLIVCLRKRLGCRRWCALITWITASDC